MFYKATNFNTEDLFSTPNIYTASLKIASEYLTSGNRSLVKFNTPVISKGAEGSQRSKKEGVAQGVLGTGRGARWRQRE